MNNAEVYMDSRIPSNIEAEQAVLGAILLDYGILPQVSFLQEDDFYLVKHRMIFKAIRELAERGMSIDYLTVTEQLSKHGFSQEENSYLIGLLNSVASIGGVDDYAKIVKENSLNRLLITASTEIARLGLTNIPFADKKNKAISLISSIHSRANNALEPVGEDTEEVKLDIFKKAMNPSTVFGLPTGFNGLDKVLGGLHPSLRLVGARPSMGKTAYALTMAYNMAVLGKRVAYISYEMTQKQLIQRLISYRSGISIMEMMQGGHMFGGEITPFSDNEINILGDAADFVMQLPIFLNRTFLSMNELGDSLIERRYEDENIEAIFVDYLQLTDEDGENRNLKIGGASRKLKIIADRDEIPVTALCQLVRKVDEKDGNRASNSDLRDSGELEANADFIEFPYREDYWNLIKNPMAKKNHRFESMLTKDRLTGRAPFLFSGMYINPITGMIQETPIE